MFHGCVYYQNYFLLYEFQKFLQLCLELIVLSKAEFFLTKTLFYIKLSNLVLE